MRRLGEVMSFCPLGKTMTFDLPLTSARTGKLHPGNSVVTSTGSGGAAEEALGSTHILRCKSISIYSPFLVFFFTRCTRQVRARCAPFIPLPKTKPAHLSIGGSRLRHWLYPPSSAHLRRAGFEAST